MSLSERLQRARTQQLIEAGLLTSAHALKPEEPELVAAADDTEAPAADDVFRPVTYEVQPTGLHLVAEGPTTVADLLAHVEAMTPDEFWLQAVGFHERHEPPAELREAMLAAGRGSLDSLERLLSGDPHVAGRWLQGLPRALGGSAD